jgi:hypothetical protein
MVENNENLSGQIPSWHSNRAPPEYKPRALPLYKPAQSLSAQQYTNYSFWSPRKFKFTITSTIKTIQCWPLSSSSAYCYCNMIHNFIPRVPLRFVTTAAIYDEWHNVAALDVVTLRLRTLPVGLGCMRSCRTRRHRLMSVLNMICGTEWTVKNCDSFRCVPNTHTTLSPVTDLWFHIDSEQYDCQFIPTFECKLLHLHLLLSQFHQLQIINSCFITIQQAN